jgi:hypothetical protein
MKKILAIGLMSSLLGGCAGIMDLLPGHWDPNEAAVITDARYAAAHVDCKDPKRDLETIQQKLDWLVLYTASKGRDSNDVGKMLKPAKDSLDPLVERAQKGDINPLFCNLKMKIIREELEAVARGANARNMP